MTTKAIGYVRVSTDKQADRGVSLEAQVEKIRAMATVHDVELVEIITDAGESAKDLDRPGMVRILEMVQSRAVGMVIVAKLDRLTRADNPHPPCQTGVQGIPIPPRTCHCDQEDGPSWYFRGAPLGLETLPGMSGAGRGQEAKRSAGNTRGHGGHSDRPSGGGPRCRLRA